MVSILLIVECCIICMRLSRELAELPDEANAILAFNYVYFLPNREILGTILFSATSLNW